MKLAAYCQTGRVIPAILFVVFFADVLMRFRSIDWLTFRAWESLQNHSGRGGPFKPNSRYSSDQVYGDLAAMGNLIELRHYRSTTFTTDADGYRNSPESGRMSPSVILFGTSFTVGLGVNDEETLAVQLERLAGSPVYNAGRPASSPAGIGLIRSIARRLNITEGLVVMEDLERYGSVLLPSPNGRGQAQSEDPLEGREPQGVLSLQSARYLISTSPLRIAAQRCYKNLQNDRVFPNVYAKNVTVVNLRNGQPMIFLHTEWRGQEQMREAPAAVENLAWLAAELKQDNLALVVVLIPDKYTVYQPLFECPSSEADLATPYLDYTEKALRERGIHTVNLTEPLRRQAARELDRGNYLYWLDDTHWNAAGIAVSANEIHQRCKDLWPTRREK